MSNGSYLPRRMRPIIPPNGYESPNELPARRHGYFSGGSEETNVGSAASSDTNGVLGGVRNALDAKGAQATRKVAIRDRIGCYTWTWFTMTMATGGIANVLNSIPYRSKWLYGIGVFFLLFNITLFVLNCILITLRFHFNPGSLRASFISQSESLFIPACIVSVGTILINISQYGLGMEGYWLQTTMQVLFWIYAAVSMLASCGIYLILWSTQSFPIHNMTPIWIFPAYPLLLSAPFASNLIDALPGPAEASRINAIAISLGAITLQGTGFLVSLNIYGAFIYRLMTQKLPQDTLKPGMFVSVGPSGFTAAGLVHLGNVLFPKVLPTGFMGTQDGAALLKLVLDLVGLWLWGLCIWFFIVSVGAHWKILLPTDPEHKIHFNMTWYSYVFPNTAFVTATQAIGKTLESNAIKVVGTAMTCVLVVLWLFVFCMMIRALVRKRLLWPEEENTVMVLGLTPVNRAKEIVDGSHK